MFKLLFLVTFFSTTNLGGGVPAGGDEDCAAARTAGRACSIEFDGDDVVGDVLSPDGNLVLVRKGPQFDSLIRYRESFDDRIVAELDDLDRLY